MPSGSTPRGSEAADTQLDAAKPPPVAPTPARTRQAAHRMTPLRLMAHPRPPQMSPTAPKLAASKAMSKR